MAPTNLSGTSEHDMCAVAVEKSDEMAPGDNEECRDREGASSNFQLSLDH